MLGHSLRPCTYEVRPEELIHVPNTVNHSVKSKRRAAIQARENIKAQVQVVQTQRRKLNHGWREEDQVF